MPGAVSEARPALAEAYTTGKSSPSLLVIIQQVQEQVVGLLHDFWDSSVAAVDLVDHKDDWQFLGQSLAEHEAGLGKRTLRGVDQEQHPIDHLQATLNFAAEVGVARRVDDVDGDGRTVRQPVTYGGVLGEDGDALLSLQVHRVQHPFLDSLADAKRPRLPEHRVDQGGLAMVDVGDDRYVPQIRTDGHAETLSQGGGNPASLWQRQPDACLVAARASRCGS